MNLHDKPGVSICIFGSSARASTDQLSDKDILVTAENPALALETVGTLRDEGWSVAFFCRSRLERMAEAGSLFILHLKLEGRIVRDPEFWLEGLIDDFHPKSCYMTDVVKSFELILPLERLMKWVHGSQMAADLGYVFMRNHAINMLASQGIYLFDYRSLMEELQGFQGFTSKCLERLIELREGKHIYRSGRIQNSHPKLGQKVAETVSEACPQLNLQPISMACGIRKFDLTYATLRDFEAALLVGGFEPCRDGFECKALERAWKTIRNPREYSWQVRSINEKWIERADSFLRQGITWPNQLSSQLAAARV